MVGLVPAIHALLALLPKTWMPGTRPGMTAERLEKNMTDAFIYDHVRTPRGRRRRPMRITIATGNRAIPSQTLGSHPASFAPAVVPAIKHTAKTTTNDHAVGAADPLSAR